MEARGRGAIRVALGTPWFCSFFLFWKRDRHSPRHPLQKEWPQGKSSGSFDSSRHIPHAVSVTAAAAVPPLGYEQLRVFLPAPIACAAWAACALVQPDSGGGTPGPGEGQGCVCEPERLRFAFVNPKDSKRRNDASTIMSTMENPQPFEVALIRKLKSKTKSVRDAFLLLDADGDGHISPDDIRTVTHNELGITLTVVMPSSQAGLAVSAGLERQESEGVEAPIHLRHETVINERRHVLRDLMGSHSSNSAGVRITSLFLAIDVHRSGRVTMQELLDWINTEGNLTWTMEDLEEVVSRGQESELQQQCKQWFPRSSEAAQEAGMTEYQFALFVESL
ncbi:hypothetical protein THAOC_02559 [Thalassiosira oceanica]|uniref:EF-hand domain-containing protein n=1 Tax=Thalassiosira oceanica TaxID=159749 RepID=K0TFB4_THAOC|nr:hypothetical protein THAOC_02559 [Thalassiosira oceanica]|eukprot:EJK75709.1 hypothetical protein THAOC_02559 [Thalassiosira oceanica]